MRWPQLRRLRVSRDRRRNRVEDFRRSNQTFPEAVTARSQISLRRSAQRREDVKPTYGKLDIEERAGAP